MPFLVVSEQNRRGGTGGGGEGGVKGYEGEGGDVEVVGWMKESATGSG